MIYSLSSMNKECNKAYLTISRRRSFHTSLLWILIIIMILHHFTKEELIEERNMWKTNKTIMNHLLQDKMNSSLHIFLVLSHLHIHQVSFKILLESIEIKRWKTEEGNSISSLFNLGTSMIIIKTIKIYHKIHNDHNIESSHNLILLNMTSISTLVNLHSHQINIQTFKWNWIH